MHCNIQLIWIWLDLAPYKIYCVSWRLRMIVLPVLKKPRIGMLLLFQRGSLAIPNVILFCDEASSLFHPKRSLLRHQWVQCVYELKAGLCVKLCSTVKKEMQISCSIYVCQLECVTLTIVYWFYFSFVSVWFRKWIAFSNMVPMQNTNLVFAIIAMFFGGKKPEVSLSFFMDLFHYPQIVRIPLFEKLSLLPNSVVEVVSR